MDTSGVKVDTSGIKVDTSDVKVDTSDINVDTSGDNTGIPVHDVDSAEIRKSRIPKQELFKQITLACNEEFKTIEEIASIVGKDPKYLKNRIFPEMIKTGLLYRLYPTINHPNQAYKSHGS